MPEVVVRARACYRLRQYEACVDLLRDALAAPDPPAGARRWLGLALGRLGEPAAAAHELRLAVEAEPADGELRASLAAAQLRAGQVPDALPGSPEGACGEIAGAAAWARGQALLREGGPAEAATLFGEAARLFARHSPPVERETRVAAACLSEAVSRVLADQLDAAAQAFSRVPTSAGVPPGHPELARQLFEMVALAGRLSPRERREALAPLAGLVRGLRLRVGPYEPGGRAEIRWEEEDA